jgi:hypothetical protein
MSFKVWVVGILPLAVALGHAVAAAQPRDVIKIGGMCDRTGASKVIGVELCPGAADYIALVNKQLRVWRRRARRRRGWLGHRPGLPRPAVRVSGAQLPCHPGDRDRDQGKDVPKYVGSAYYNRGVLTAAMIVEGIRLAIQNHGLPVTGDKVRRGYEAIRKLDLQGLGPPLNITAQDHEGGGYLRLDQVRGNGWVPVTDWMRGYHDEVTAPVKKANNK